MAVRKLLERFFSLEFLHFIAASAVRSFASFELLSGLFNLMINNVFSKSFFIELLFLLFNCFIALAPRSGLALVNGTVSGIFTEKTIEL